MAARENNLKKRCDACGLLERDEQSCRVLRLKHTGTLLRTMLSALTTNCYKFTLICFICVVISVRLEFLLFIFNGVFIVLFL